MAAKKKKTSKKQRSAKADTLATPAELRPSLAAQKSQRKIIHKKWGRKNPVPSKDDRENIQLDENMRPLGGMTVYPTADPYTSDERQTWRLIRKKVPQINRANNLIRKLVATAWTTEIHPMEDKNISPEQLEEWEETPIKVPYFKDEEMTPHEIKEWVDRKLISMDLQMLIYNSYLEMREQGRSVIGIFPETRDPDTQKYMMPEALRLIKNEWLIRPLLSSDDGSLQAVEVVGLKTNGGRLDANRMQYLTNQDNLDLFADFYGVSEIETLEDIGSTLITINAQDLPQGALHTWWKPRVFQMTIPARDHDRANSIMDEFLQKLKDSQGRDVCITQNVELVSGTENTPGTNLETIINIKNNLIEDVIGFYNVPKFLLGKGEAGNLGGNADREEVDAFLNIEIRPEQINLENMLEQQIYRYIMGILFDVDPGDEKFDEKVPAKIRHLFKKPDISASVNLEQYQIALDMLEKGLIDEDKLLEKFGIADIKKETKSRGGDISPPIRTWVKRNSHWQPSKLSRSGMKTLSRREVTKVPKWKSAV